MIAPSLYLDMVNIKPQVLRAKSSRLLRMQRPCACASSRPESGPLTSTTRHSKTRTRNSHARTSVREQPRLRRLACGSSCRVLSAPLGIRRRRTSFFAVRLQPQDYIFYRLARFILIRSGFFYCFYDQRDLGVQVAFVLVLTKSQGAMKEVIIGNILVVGLTVCVP